MTPSITIPEQHVQVSDPKPRRWLVEINPSCGPFQKID